MDAQQPTTNSQIPTTIVNTLAQDPLNPPQAGGGKLGTGKEAVGGGVLDAIVAEVPGATAIETEKNAEIPPELASWMEKVETHQVQPPQQVVVADQTATNLTGNYVAQPVIVLPLSQQKVQQGTKKSVVDSMRWLAEWCIRIIKKFHGKVVYRATSE